MNESIEFINKYCTFDNPDEVWILKGISRNKDNKEGFHRFMRRVILVTPDDIEECYKDIRGMGNRNGTEYRMYISLNSRNVIKGMFEFQKKLLDISHGVARGLADMKMLTTKLASVWKTELEQNNCRGTKRFLLDIDSQDKELLDRVHNYLANMGAVVHTFRKTVSGYVIVIDACDMRGFYKEFEGQPIDVQKDSMVFVEKWTGNA